MHILMKMSIEIRKKKGRQNAFLDLSRYALIQFVFGDDPVAVHI